MISLDSLAAGWQTFFHAPQSPATIGAFRVVWGLLLFLCGALLWRDATRFFGPRGLLSAERYHRAFGRSRFTLFHVLPDKDSSVHLVLGTLLVASLLLAVGWQTGWMAAVCFLTLVSLHHRNPAVFHAGDSVLRLLTFLLIFSRAGDAYSVDQWLAAEDAQQRWVGAESSPWAQRLMQLQVCIVYVRTVYWKLRGKHWPRGTAAYFPTQVDSFRRMRMPRWAVNRALVAVATWSTLGIEVSLGLLIWIRELRYPVLVMGVALHLGLEVLMNLQLFGWTMIASLLLFVDPGHLAAWLAATVALAVDVHS